MLRTLQTCVAVLLLNLGSGVALARTAPQEPLPETARPPAAESLDAARLSQEIDLSIRWLRAAWNAETSQYGDLAAQTAALSALVHSPRRYRYQDGPFVGRAVDHLLSRVGPDGLWRTAGTDDAAARAATHEVREVLLALRGVPAVDRALVNLDELGFEGPARGLPRSNDPASARALALALLAERRGDGSFGGNVLDTARAVLALSGAQRDLAAAEPKSATRQARPLPAFAPADAARAEQALARGAAFLVLSPAKPEVPGRFGVGGDADAGITAMVISALQTLPAPRPANIQDQIDAGLKWLRELQKPDGSIHDGRLANYVTSASVMALIRAGDPLDTPRLVAARDFLRRLQADGDEGYDEAHRYYGGVGYGGDERPDLSNLQLALEALAATGLESEDETFQRALVFLQRTQNRTESNDLVVVEDGFEIRSGNDGGAGYAPGESKAGFLELPDGSKVPRSYGSMTYALLRGYLFAGLTKEDPRVQAAWNWLRDNYTLDVNPGFETGRDATAAYQGLFYYFYSMAKALDTYGEEVIVDPAGTPHPWRAQLTGRIAAMQRPDGSWINDNSPRWWEGNPVLASAYAMLVLDTARPHAEPAAPTQPVPDDPR